MRMSNFCGNVRSAMIFVIHYIYPFCLFKWDWINPIRKIKFNRI